MFVAAGGLVFWKMQSNSQAEPVVEETRIEPPKKEESAPILDNAPPPPPTEEEAAEQEEEEKKPETDAKPTVAAKGPPGCGGSCKGSVSGALQSALTSRAGRARTCYNTALRRNSTLQGKMTVSVRLSPQGSVCSAHVSNNTSGDAALAACVASQFRAASFPAPTGGCLDVAVPMNFTPKQ